MEKSKAYVDLEAAEKEIEKILADMDQVLNSPDRRAAEKIILAEYAPRMDAAIKKEREAFDKWMQETDTLLQKKV